MLFYIDNFITLFINKCCFNKFFDLFFGFFHILTYTGFIFIFIILIYFLLFLIKRRFRYLLFSLIVFFTVALSIVLASVIKKIAKRQRPFKTIEVRTPIQTPDSFSFPSTQTSAVFALFFVSKYLKNKKLQFCFLTLAIFTALSRIYLGHHYFFDVLVGIFIGFISYKVVFMFLNIELTDFIYLKKRRSNEKTP